MKKSKTMKIISSFYGIMLLSLAVSCTQVRENDLMPQTPGGDPEPSGTITFTAHFDADSRTQFGDDWSVLWSEGDAIQVFNESHPEGVTFTLVGGEGTPAGMFRGPDPGAGPFRAVYPAGRTGQGNGTSVPVSFPSTQPYAEGSFGPGANLAAGMADQLDGLRFHNLSGALSLTLTGSGSITGIRVCSYAEEQLSGAATLSGWTEGTPAVSFDAGQAGESFREVYLDCGTGVALSGDGKPFYLTVPAGTLAGGYRIEVYDADGLAMVKYAKAHEDSRVDQGEVVLMPALAYNPAYKAAFLRSEAIGAFANAAAQGEMASLCTYVEGVGQYAYLNQEGVSRYLRLEDWDAGYALGFTMPYSLQAGKNCSVSLQSIGLNAVPSGTVENMRIIKLSGDRVWMMDPATGRGFILMMEE